MNSMRMLMDNLKGIFDDEFILSDMAIYLLNSLGKSKRALLFCQVLI